MQVKISDGRVDLVEEEEDDDEEAAAAAAAISALGSTVASTDGGACKLPSRRATTSSAAERTRVARAHAGDIDLRISEGDPPAQYEVPPTFVRPSFDEEDGSLDAGADELL